MNLPADKAWHITFTKPADADTITKDNVYVVDSNGSKVEVKVSYDSDNVLIVAPVKAYIYKCKPLENNTERVNPKPGAPRNAFFLIYTSVELSQLFEKLKYYPTFYFNNNEKVHLPTIYLINKINKLKSENDFSEIKTSKVNDQFYEITNNPEFANYLSYLAEERIVDSDQKKIGAIVMNCNPFTLGHQYLIQFALESVEYLYIFLVEENKSEFSFEDRYNMVKAGISDFKNVKLLRSGKFIISSVTFPEYFTKEANCTKDNL